MIYKQNFKTKTMATTIKQFEALEYRKKLNNCLKNIICTSDITCVECHKNRSSEVSCDLAGFNFFLPPPRKYVKIESFNFNTYPLVSILRGWVL